MKDYATSKDRITNPHKKWVRESLKEFLLTLTCFTVLFVLFTNPPIGVV